MSNAERNEAERLRVGIARRPDGVLLVTLAGYLDAGTFDLAEKALEKALSEGHCRMIVNMSELTYLGSAGAGVLLAAINRARALGGEVVLLKPTPAVADVLALIGMNTFCKFADTIEQANGIFRARPS